MLGLWREHQNIVLWNRDPKDFAHEDAAPVARWFAQNPVAGGDIVLLHDVHPHAARVLPDLIADARRRGLRFCTPTEWLE
jgi:peptidoglycan/xylan/chitin deacetylase (PgdA/CDA1 family)